MRPRSVHLPPVALGDVRELTARLGGMDDDDQVAVRLRRGAVGVVTRDSGEHERARELFLARCVAVERCLTVSHAFVLESAALLLGLPVWRVPEQVQVASPQRRSGSAAAPDVRRHSYSVPVEDIVVVRGMPVTGLRRLAIDAARLLAPRDALVLVDSIFAVLCRADPRDRQRVEEDANRLRTELIERLRAEFKGARGVRQAIAVLTWSSPWAESPWESHLRWVLLTWGVRGAVAQCSVVVGARVYRADLAILVGRRTDGGPLWMLIEFDGRAKYGDDPDGTSGALVKERRRDVEVERLGHRVVHLTARDAIDRGVVEARIRERMPSGVSLELAPVTELLPRRSSGAPGRGRSRPRAA